MAPVTPSRENGRLGALVFTVLSALTWGCGTQGDASALPNLWPSSGLAGYAFHNADSPILISRFGWDLDEPAVEIGAGMPTPFVAWGRMAPVATPLQSVLFRSKVTDLDTADEPVAALSPTLPWEGQGLRGPTIIPAGDLSLLFYQGEDGSVGLARLDGVGDGVHKLSLDAPLASAALLGGGRRIGRLGVALYTRADGPFFRMAYTLDDAEVYVAEAAAAAILAIGSGQSASPSWQVRPLGLLASDFQVPPGDSKSMPATSISSLSLRQVITPADRPRWDLFVLVADATKTSLVAASAYADPNGDEHFTAGMVPLIKPMAGVAVTPTVLTYRNRPLLLCGLQQSPTGIAVAEQP